MQHWQWKAAAGAGLVALIVLSAMPGTEPSRDMPADAPQLAEKSVRELSWSAESLERLEFDEVLTLLGSELNGAVARGAGSDRWDVVGDIAERLETIHQRNTAALDRAATYYRSHSAAAHARFETFRKEYQQRYRTVRELVAASTTGEANAPQRLVELLHETGAWSPPRNAFQHGNPMRRLQPRATAPRVTAEAWQEHEQARNDGFHWWRGNLAYAQGAGDLDETPEILFTPENAPEIQALLDDPDLDLRDHPDKIIEWVRENIEFVPFWGGIQSSVTCFQNRRGTAIDIATLTMALLRATNVECRYQAGTVRVPIDFALNWLGDIENADVAASILSSGGIPATVLVDGTGTPLSLRFEHVWVRADIDYVPSRGTCHDEGDLWLDVDAAMKVYDYPAPADFTALLPWDDQGGTVTPEEAAQDFLDSLTVGAITDEDCGTFSMTNYTPLDELFGIPSETLTDDILAQMNPDLSVRELFGAGTVRPTASRGVSQTPPFEVVARGWEVSELDDAERFKVDIRVEHAGGTLLDVQIPAHEVGASRFTVHYGPVEELDGSIIFDQLFFAGDPDTEPMFDDIYVAGVNVVPELWRDGGALVIGDPVEMGTPVELVVDFVEPVLSTPPIRGSFHAGEPVGIGLDLIAIPDALMERVFADYEPIWAELTAPVVGTNFNSDHLLDTILAAIANSWFREIDQINGLSSLALGAVTHRYPSAGFASVGWNPDTLFGLTLGISHKGFTVDIPGDVVLLLARDGDPARTFYTSVFQGMSGSSLESQIPASFFFNDLEQSFWVSTADTLAVAGRLGDTLSLISDQNRDCVLPLLDLAPEEIAEVQEALDLGYVVLAHLTPLSGLNSVQAGYAMLDPQTGSGIFRMSGGYDGGNRAQCIADANGSITPATERLSRMWTKPYASADSVGTSILTEILGGLDVTSMPLSATKALNSIWSVYQTFTHNAELYNQSAVILGDETAAPLAGLVVLFTGLDLLNQILGATLPPPASSVLSVTLGPMINGMTNAAWIGVRNIIRHQARITAAEAGIVLPGECLELLF